MPAILWTVWRSTWGKVAVLALAAGAACLVAYWIGHREGGADLAAKVTTKTLEDTRKAREHGERIEHETEQEPDRRLIECLRAGNC